MQSVVALMAVAADYNSLSRAAARGSIPAGKKLEAAWHAAHKRAAQRVAQYMTDLPEVPPLQPALRVFERLSIAAGIAVGGCGLLGATPGLHEASAQSWPGGGGSGWGAAAGGGAGSSGDSAQLLLSASLGLSAPAGPATFGEPNHLSRPELMHLFYGEDAELPADGSNGAGGGERCLPAAHCGAGSACGRQLPASGAAVAAHDDAASPATAQASRQIRDSASSSPRALRGHASGTPFSPPLLCVAEALPDCAAAAGLSSSVSASGAARLARAMPTQPARGASSSGVSSSSASGSDCGAEAGQDALAFMRELPLYGQADHMEGSRGGSSGGSDGFVVRVQLAVRGAYLLLVFAPFALLGVPLLLVSWYMLARVAAIKAAAEDGGTGARQRLRGGFGSTAAQAGTNGEADGADEPLWGCDGGGTAAERARQVARRVRTVALARLRALLALLLAWVDVLAAGVEVLLALLLGGRWEAGVSAWESSALHMRRSAWVLLNGSCRRAGAAFIKWGQWSATRRDLFPDDFCEVLSSLHDRAPTHSARYSRKAITRAFGRTPAQMFESFEAAPLASGSIAQVHRARWRAPDGGLVEVAVKVGPETFVLQCIVCGHCSAACLGWWPCIARTASSTTRNMPSPPLPPPPPMHSLFP